MLPRGKVLTTLALLGAAMAVAGAALADDHRGRGSDDHAEHDDVRHAVESGEIRPLSDVLRIVGPQLNGEVVGIEIEREEGQWIYELRVASASGRLLEVYVDAASAKIIETKEK